MEFKFSDIEEFKMPMLGINVFPMMRMLLKWQSDQKRRDNLVKGGYSM